MRSAHLFYPLSGSIDLRKLTVPECASKSEKSFVITRCFGSSNRKQARTREARTCGEYMHGERLRLPKVYTRCSVPSSNAWASACRQEHALAFVFGPSRWTACGLTRREKNPASAEGWRASSSVARVVSNGRRLRAVLVDIRATACSPAMLKHAIVLRPRRTRDLMVKIGDHENIFATHLSSKRSARYTLRSRVTGLGVGWGAIG